MNKKQRLKSQEKDSRLQFELEIDKGGDLRSFNEIQSNCIESSSPGAFQSNVPAKRRTLVPMKVPKYAKSIPDEEIFELNVIC